MALPKDFDGYPPAEHKRLLAQDKKNFAAMRVIEFSVSRQTLRPFEQVNVKWRIAVAHDFRTAAGC